MNTFHRAVLMAMASVVPMSTAIAPTQESRHPENTERRKGKRRTSAGPSSGPLLGRQRPAWFYKKRAVQRRRA